MAVVKDVKPASIAADTGLKRGDVIQTMAGQPLLSIADVQWVLHHVDPKGGEVPMKILRQGSEMDLMLSLDDGWRRASDISWRVTTWGLRRIGGGGMVIKEADDGGLFVGRVGKYGPHGAARKAGIREGDTLISYDGRSDFQSEQDILTYVATQKKIGDHVKVKVNRDGRELTFTLPIQR